MIMKRIFFYTVLFLLVNSLFIFSKYNVERASTYNPNFSSSKFKDWLLVATFDKDNIPSFEFIEKSEDKYWELNNEDTKEYKYSGKNSKAGMFFISSMTYYQYRGYNP